MRSARFRCASPTHCVITRVDVFIEWGLAIATLWWYFIRRLQQNRKRWKGKGRTLAIAPPSEGTSLRKRSGMTRVVEGFHSFTCTSTRLSTNGWRIPARLPLLFQSKLVLIYRYRRDGRIEGYVGPSLPKTVTWQLPQLSAAEAVTPHHTTQHKVLFHQYTGSIIDNNNNIIWNTRWWKHPFLALKNDSKYR